MINKLDDDFDDFDDSDEDGEPKLRKLHPSLEQVVVTADLDATLLRVDLKLRPDGRDVDMSARDAILLSDGSKQAEWRVPSVRALFRGDVVPPSMADEPPEEYQPLFSYIERHVLNFSDALGEKTDLEFEEAYSNLRRRPDGKSLSPLHFYLWQAGAALVGQWEISAAEYEAIFGRLAISASTFHIGLVSRNYISALRLTL